MRGIDKLHPELQIIAMEFQSRCRKAGLNVLVTETFRTKEEQTALYAQGRTTPGAIITRAKYPYSPHCWGVAFDFCRNEKGREYDNADGFFEACGGIGKGLGLTWGGDWKDFVDRPHLELTKYMPGASCKWLISIYGTPEAFLRTWPKAEETPSVPEKPEKPVEKEEDEMTVYKTFADLPDWGKPAVEKLVEKKVLTGDEEGNLNLSEELLRMCVILDRLNLV